MLQPASCKNLAVVKYEFLVVPSTSIIVSGNVTGDFSYSRYGVIYIKAHPPSAVPLFFARPS